MKTKTYYLSKFDLENLKDGISVNLRDQDGYNVLITFEDQQKEDY